MSCVQYKHKEKNNCTDKNYNIRVSSNQMIFSSLE